MSSTRQNATAVNAEISTLIAGSTPSVKAAYVKTQVDQEIASRTETFTRAMDKLKSLKGELNKVKADNKTIKLSTDADGKEVRTTEESWTADGLKKRDEAQKKVKDLEAAIEAFLTDEVVEDPNKQPYKLLKELMGKLN